MSSLFKKKIEIKIDRKDYIMAFDMKSVVMFHEITGKTFTNAMPELFAGVDFIILGFLGATLRPKNKPKEPVGKSIFKEFDILGLLMNQGNDVTTLIAKSLPKSDEKKQ